MGFDCRGIVSIGAQEIQLAHILRPLRLGGEMPHGLMTECDHVATNTFSKGQRGQATCFFDGRKGPRQLDFVLAHRDGFARRATRLAS
eukprot:573188-Pyramimonas_sp.AAC.1